MLDVKITHQQDNNLSKQSPELRTMKFYSTLFLNCFFTFRYYHVSEACKQTKKGKESVEGEFKVF